MSKRLLFTSILVLAMVFCGTAYADRGKPNFGPALYADGETWGTKGTTTLPMPNEYNTHSFDKLFVITNSNNPDGQLPVSEAAPGNPDYNGGRWYTHTAEWTEEGFTAHGIVPVIKSYDMLMHHYNLGHINIMPGSFPGGPPMFFQCPLLPDKTAR